MDELLISAAGAAQGRNLTVPRDENLGQTVSGGKRDGEHSGGAFPVMMQGNLYSVTAEQSLSGKQPEAEVFFICPSLCQGGMPLRMKKLEQTPPSALFRKSAA